MCGAGCSRGRDRVVRGRGPRMGARPADRPRQLPLPGSGGRPVRLGSARRPRTPCPARGEGARRRAVAATGTRRAERVFVGQADRQVDRVRRRRWSCAAQGAIRPAEGSPTSRPSAARRTSASPTTRRDSRLGLCCDVGAGHRSGSLRTSARRRGSSCTDACTRASMRSPSATAERSCTSPRDTSTVVSTSIGCSWSALRRRPSSGAEVLRSA